jgi:ubiquinone/menaquinone biosynthesis C-methylase UbiE
MLNVAKRKVGHAENVHFVRADAETLPFRNGSFEEIVISRAFKFFPNPSKALSEGYTALKSYGKYIISLETSDPFWIRVAFIVNLPYPGAKFEWRYRQDDVRVLFEKNCFVVNYARCVLYFGRSAYEITGKYCPPLLRFLELIDSHSKKGRNIIIVGVKKRAYGKTKLFQK